MPAKPVNQDFYKDIKKHAEGLKDDREKMRFFTDLAYMKDDMTEDQLNAFLMYLKEFFFPVKEMGEDEAELEQDVFEERFTSYLDFLGDSAEKCEEKWEAYEDSLFSFDAAEKTKEEAAARQNAGRAGLHKSLLKDRDTRDVYKIGSLSGLLDIVLRDSDRERKAVEDSLIQKKKEDSPLNLSRIAKNFTDTKFTQKRQDTCRRILSDLRKSPQAETLVQQSLRDEIVRKQKIWDFVSDRKTREALYEKHTLRAEKVRKDAQDLKARSEERKTGALDEAFLQSIGDRLYSMPETENQIRFLADLTHAGKEMPASRRKAAEQLVKDYFMPADGKGEIDGTLLSQRYTAYAGFLGQTAAAFHDVRKNLETQAAEMLSGMTEIPDDLSEDIQYNIQLGIAGDRNAGYMYKKDSLAEVLNREIFAKEAEWQKLREACGFRAPGEAPPENAKDRLREAVSFYSSGTEDQKKDTMDALALTLPPKQAVQKELRKELAGAQKKWEEEISRREAEEAKKKEEKEEPEDEIEFKPGEETDLEPEEEKKENASRENQYFPIPSNDEEEDEEKEKKEEAPKEEEKKDEVLKEAEEKKEEKNGQVKKYSMTEFFRKESEKKKAGEHPDREQESAPNEKEQQPKARKK